MPRALYLPRKEAPCRASHSMGGPQRLSRRCEEKNILPLLDIELLSSLHICSLAQWYSTWVRVPPGVREEILAGT
jgi:hypothetical protein